MSEEITSRLGPYDVDPKDWITQKEWELGASYMNRVVGRVIRHYWTCCLRANGPDFPRIFPEYMVANLRAHAKKNNRPNPIIIIPESEVSKYRELAHKARRASRLEK